MAFTPTMTTSATFRRDNQPDQPATARRRRAFTLLELLTLVAGLVIALGLMVSLARRVRSASAVDLTRTLLRRLDALMALYETRYQRLPAVAPFVTTGNADLDERALQAAAVANNRQVLAALRGELGVSQTPFSGLPDAIYDENTLRDAWGTPLVFMPAMHPAIGMAPQNRRFFLSAGPDRQFLTQEDNLYSYEEGRPTLAPSTRPADAGHSE